MLFQVRKMKKSLFKPLINIEKIFSDHETLTQFLLEPNSLNLSNDTRIHINDPISTDIFYKGARTAPF